MRRHLTAVVFVAALAGSVIATWVGVATAARNSSGTMSLASGNPVVTGTTISSTTYNNTMSDIANELTNSLDRQGRGAMTAALQLASGSVSNPGLTFSSDTDCGLYRGGANDIRIAAGGAEVERWTSSGTSFALPVLTGVTVNQSTTNGHAVVATANGTGSAVVGTGGASNGAGGFFTGGATNGNGVNGYGTGTGDGVMGTGSGSASSSGVIGFAGGGAETVGKYAAVSGFSAGTVVAGYFEQQGTGAALQTSGGMITGATGTEINSIWYTTATWDAPALTAPECQSTTATVTGATAGAPCLAGATTALTNNSLVDCKVTSADTVTLRVCAFVSNADNPSRTYTILVFQP